MSDQELSWPVSPANWSDTRTCQVPLVLVPSSLSNSAPVSGSAFASKIAGQVGDLNSGIQVPVYPGELTAEVAEIRSFVDESSISTLVRLSPLPPSTEARPITPMTSRP